MDINFIEFLLITVEYTIIGAFFMMFIESYINDGEDRFWAIGVWPILIVIIAIDLSIWGAMKLGEFLGTKLNERNKK